MRQVTLAIVTLLISLSSFAVGLSKGSSQLSALQSAWKSHQTLQPKNDIEIVYGGADVANNPALMRKAIA